MSLNSSMLMSIYRDRSIYPFSLSIPVPLSTYVGKSWARARKKKSKKSLLWRSKKKKIRSVVAGHRFNTVKLCCTFPSGTAEVVAAEASSNQRRWVRRGDTNSIEMVLTYPNADPSSNQKWHGIIRGRQRCSWQNRYSLKIRECSGSSTRIVFHCKRRGIGG